MASPVLARRVVLLSPPTSLRLPDTSCDAARLNPPCFLLILPLGQSTSLSLAPGKRLESQLTSTNQVVELQGFKRPLVTI